ncbi:hypothetical protein EMPS_02805 [Entomortierella parvispora]|uniref:R3H domain-containing protein n=1 Tax=Entomortierella parvispora TaxID=205924 RepID=A0A9P3H5G7_9FUNG|nr:hypothetical protein EMPS_02805 [Entomortierella parvispora]
MTTKQLDMSFDAMSLRDNGISSPVDRRYSQYGSERAPTSPVARKPTAGSQRNSMRGGDNRRQSSRLSVANLNWSPPHSSPVQSPMLQQDPRQLQHMQQQVYGYQQSPMAQQPAFDNQQALPQTTEESTDTIPTAIVIKNIPFSVKRDALLAILDNLDIPKPYAFNYHFDNGIFRGLAFANYRTSEETDIVVAAVNGLEVSGRKLRVEFKKVMPAAEQEKREQDKAAALAAEALHRRELELMEAQLLEQERREQERREHERRELELQNREFERERRNRASAVLERRDSQRSNERDDASMTQLDLNDGETLAFYDRLLMFRGDSTKDDMIFPENLSGRQRRILHLIADKLSLYHFSEGEGNVRRLIIMKTPPPNAVMEAPAPRSPKQRPMSFAGRGNLRAESPVMKAKNSAHDVATGSASPTRSLYRKSMVLNPDMASNIIYPIRQPKGPEPGKVFTIREQKQLRDATMIVPAFEVRPQITRSFSGRSISLDVKAPSFKPAMA